MQTDNVLFHANGTAPIEAPIATIDIAEWLRTLPDAEFRRCAPGEHKAAGLAVSDDGRPMSVTVETIGPDLYVGHYHYEIARRDHCRLVSVSDVLTPAGWTSCQVIWELRAEPAGDTSRLSSALTGYPTAEFLRFTADQGRDFAPVAAAAQTALAQHCRRETPRYAMSIGRHANAHG